MDVSFSEARFDFPRDLMMSIARPASQLSSKPMTPTNDDIEAVIQMATANLHPRHLDVVRPPRDTRTQLFVGNLPYRVRWQDLKDLFRRAGSVLRADVSLGPDNRSRGYGTVLLASAEDAGRAIDMFNGFAWQSRVLEVRLDRLGISIDGEYPSGPPDIASDYDRLYSSLFAHDGGGGQPLSTGPVSKNLFVGNLPFHIQWQDLKDLFRTSGGTILRADVALGQDGRSRGFGTVAFATEADAERARVLFDGSEFNGRILKVHFDKFTNVPTPTANSLLSASPRPPADALSLTRPSSGYTSNGGSAYASPATTSFPSTFASPTVLSSSSPNASFVSPIPRLAPAAVASSLARSSSVLSSSLVKAGSSLLSSPTLPASFPATTSSSPLSHGLLQKTSILSQRSQSFAHLIAPRIPNQDDCSLDGYPTLDSSEVVMCEGSKPKESTEYAYVDRILAASLASQHISPERRPHSDGSSAGSGSNFSNAESTTPPSSLGSASEQPKNEKMWNDPTASKPLRKGPIRGLRAQQQQHSQHPRHPGPISLPPFGPVSMSPYQSFMPPHLSPMHHPVMTPHGLPPITPSMPPFTFMPPPNQSPMHHPAVPAGASSQLLTPPISPAVATHPGANVSITTPTAPASSKQQHPLNISMNMQFSPGLALSPGGYAGGAAGINPAVGAPVHIPVQPLPGFGVPSSVAGYIQPHSPGYYAAYAGSPGGYGYMPSPGFATPVAYMPGAPPVGYAGSPGYWVPMQEPKSYFDVVPLSPTWASSQAPPGVSTGRNTGVTGDQQRQQQGEEAHSLPSTDQANAYDGTSRTSKSDSKSDQSHVNERAQSYDDAMLKHASNGNSTKNDPVGMTRVESSVGTKNESNKSNITTNGRPQLSTSAQ